MSLLVSQEFLLLTSGTPLFLALDPVNPPRLFALDSQKTRLNLIEQNPSSQKSIQSLRTLCLTLDPNPGRAMPQKNTRRDLIHILSTAPGRTDKGLF